MLHEWLVADVLPTDIALSIDEECPMKWLLESETRGPSFTA